MSRVQLGHRPSSMGPLRSRQNGFNGFSQPDSDTVTNEDLQDAHNPNDLHDAPDTMQAAFDANIRPKLDAIDKVRHHLTGVDIELPAIVVVGDQSSGKSSVLESLSGIALPRGGLLVTRCPLELALRHGQEESAVLSYTHPKNNSQDVTKHIQLAEIPDAVNAATSHLAGDNSGLVPSLISLKVTKPDAPDLTLIDLPGIVRNPIGDQPADIEQQIRELILKYLKGDSKVSLCVLPATADFATQEAIKISRQVDPSGKRTVGVVTKIDLAEAGIKDRLEATGAEHLRLELGYVAVRSRTNKELTEGITSQQARAKEAKLFEEDPELKQLAPEFKGVPALSRKLVDIQADRIQSHLPALQKQVNGKLRAAEKQMHSMQGVISTEVEAEKCLSDLLENMHRRAVALVDAAPDVSAGDHKAKDLHIGPRVNELLETYMEELWEAVGGKDVFRTSKCHDMLREHSREARGATLANMMGDRLFNGIFEEQVYSNLEPSATDLVENVHKYMETVLWKLTEDVAAAYPKLQAAVKHLIQQKLDSLASQATASAMAIIHSEKHVFTNNAEYMKLFNKMKAHVMPKQKAAPAFALQHASPTTVPVSAPVVEDEDLANLDVLGVGSGNNEQALVDLQLALAAYTQIVVKGLCDSVPKVVYAQLVNQVARSLSSIIRDGLCSDSGTSLIDRMHDSQRVAAYKRLQETIGHLRKADTTLRML